MVTVDTSKLQVEANELRDKMMESLASRKDSEVRKLGNELAAINKQIMDAEAVEQSDARIEYMGFMHDALNEFEVDGQTLTVRFTVNEDDQETLNIALEPTPETIDLIKVAIAGIERPSSATKWIYGRDEKGEQSFDFARGSRKAPAGDGNGTRTFGWSKDGVSISLGDAFDACATAEEMAEKDSKDTGSRKYAVQTRVAKAAGYTKN